MFHDSTVGNKIPLILHCPLSFRSLKIETIKKYNGQNSFINNFGMCSKIYYNYCHNYISLLHSFLKLLECCIHCKLAKSSPRPYVAGHMILLVVPMRQLFSSSPTEDPILVPLIFNMMASASVLKDPTIIDTILKRSSFSISVLFCAYEG